MCYLYLLFYRNRSSRTGGMARSMLRRSRNGSGAVPCGYHAALFCQSMTTRSVVFGRRAKLFSFWLDSLFDGTLFTHGLVREGGRGHELARQERRKAPFEPLSTLLKWMVVPGRVVWGASQQAFKAAVNWAVCWRLHQGKNSDIFTLPSDVKRNSIQNSIAEGGFALWLYDAVFSSGV